MEGAEWARLTLKLDKLVLDKPRDIYFFVNSIVETIFNKKIVENHLLENFNC